MTSVFAFSVAVLLALVQLRVAQRVSSLVISSRVVARNGDLRAHTFASSTRASRGAGNSRLGLGGWDDGIAWLSSWIHADALRQRSPGNWLTNGT